MNVYQEVDVLHLDTFPHDMSDFHLMIFKWQLLSQSVYFICIQKNDLLMEAAQLSCWCTYTNTIDFSKIIVTIQLEPNRYLRNFCVYGSQNIITRKHQRTRELIWEKQDKNEWDIFFFMYYVSPLWHRQSPLIYICGCHTPISEVLKLFLPTNSFVPPNSVNITLYKT